MGRERLVREEDPGQCRKAVENVGGHREIQKGTGRQVRLLSGSQMKASRSLLICSFNHPEAQLYGGKC